MTSPRPIPEPIPPPHRRVHTEALPPYRYIPGLGPHPFRHPEGHMYVDGKAPQHATNWSSATPWTRDIPYLYAADLFDHRYYWEAHEAWEGLWHQCESPSHLRDVLQSMIQFAAAILKNHMGEAQSATSLCEKANRRLIAVEATQGAHLRGLNLPELRHRVSSHLQGGPWPLLPMDQT